MKYHISIEETLCRIVEVEAENEYDAIDMVQTMYDNEEIVLDADDFLGCNIEIA